MTVNSPKYIYTYAPNFVALTGTPVMRNSIAALGVRVMNLIPADREQQLGISYRDINGC
jgi:hypothetical protein